jgi:hypothetical protein
MFQLGRLIGDVFAFIGALLAIAGLLLLIAQYFVWLRTDIWRSIDIGTILEAAGVSARGAEAVLELPVWDALFIIGLVFVWIAAEVYERDARSLRGRADV